MMEHAEVIQRGDENGNEMTVRFRMPSGLEILGLPTKNSYGGHWDLGPTWNLEVRTTWLDSFFLIGDGLLLRVEAFPIDLGLSYGFDTGGKLAPYVGAGITYLDIRPVVVDSNIRNEVEVRIPEEVGINFLAGVDYPIMNDKLSLFLEATYRAIETNANSTDIRDFNVDMTGVGAAFGLVLNF